MAYVAIGIVFLLVVAAGITILVMANTKQSSPDAAEDSGAHAGTPFSGPDRTPVGDTAQHAGEPDSAGTTQTPQDAEAGGGTGAPISGPHGAGHAPSREAEEPAGGRFKRDPIGGEAEAEPTVEVGEVPHPRRDG
jgi:nucleoid-associated protein YgaU